jgi:mediator of RNA polymerase II transcription subunit 6
MQKMFNTAASMQHFHPAQGHRYILEAPTTSTKDTQSARGSRLNTPAPEELHIPTPKSSQPSVGKPTDDLNAREQSSLLRSLNMSIRYGGEFVDTNPLLGEPGQLVFTATESHLQAQAAAKAKATADKLAKEAASNAPSSIPSPTTDSKKPEVRKGSKAEKTIIGGTKPKIGRRKSRAPGSPEDD